MTKIRFGIVGCGVISDWHAQAVAALPEAQLTGVFDANQDRARSFAEKYHAEAYRSMEELLDGSVDAVCICTPSGLHAEYAVQAAKAGKHVVVEKPMGITQEQLDSVESACQKYGVKLCAVCQLLFSDSARQIKEVLSRNGLGRILQASLTMNYYRSEEYYKTGGWRGTWSMDGGGALMNQGIHGISLFRYLLGPVRSVSGIAKTMLHQIEVEDTAAAILEFESGAVGSVTASTCTMPPQPRRLEIHGEKGSIILEEDQIVLWDVPGIPNKVPNSGDAAQTALDPSAFSIENHRRQLEEFVQAVLSDRKPLVNETTGKAPVEIILAVYESSRTGKPVFFQPGI